MSGKGKRQPPPNADGGEAEAKAGEEEENVGDDDHRKRGSQDSNLEPPVLETGTLPVEVTAPALPF